MKKLEITTPITIYDSVNELPDNVQVLMDEAVKIRKTAYAPYSKFHVGTAFLLEKGVWGESSLVSDCLWITSKIVLICLSCD